MRKKAKIVRGSNNVLIVHSPECPILDETLKEKKITACFNGVVRSPTEMEILQRCSFYDNGSLDGNIGDYYLECNK